MRFFLAPGKNSEFVDKLIKFGINVDGIDAKYNSSNKSWTIATKDLTKLLNSKSNVNEEQVKHKSDANSINESPVPTYLNDFMKDIIDALNSKGISTSYSQQLGLLSIHRGSFEAITCTITKN